MEVPDVSTTEQLDTSMQVSSAADHGGLGDNTAVTSSTFISAGAKKSLANTSSAAHDATIADTSTASSSADTPDTSTSRATDGLPTTLESVTASSTDGLPPTIGADTSTAATPEGSGTTADPARLHYEGETCVYTDPSSGAQFVWDAGTSQWQPRQDTSDYEWDPERKAWFPKVDAEFLARYQLSYDFADPETKRKQAALDEEKRLERERLEDEAALKKKAPPKDPTWFEPEPQHNSKVYVSNLPADVTEVELAELMQKCGLLARDADTGRVKVKLYTEPGDSQRLKGDALCTYIKVESVELALSLIDGSELRGHTLSVQRATFQMKGNYDPTLKPKKKRRKDKDKVKKQQESLFDWRPDRMRGERGKNERTVVVKNLFDAKQFEADVSLILEFNQDLREECGKCGTVKKVVIYDRHPEGVATVTFEDPAEADVCIRLLNLRWFGQRRITADTWDGKTKYKVAETEAEKQARLNKWDSFLVAGETDPGAEVTPKVTPGAAAAEVTPEVTPVAAAAEVTAGLGADSVGNASAMETEVETPESSDADSPVPSPVKDDCLLDLPRQD